MTTKLPTFPVPFDKKWQHMSGLYLADPDFGVTEHVDILLGSDVFSPVVRQDWGLGPSGSPLALNIGFGWALSGMVKLKHPQQDHVQKRIASSW